MVVIDTVDGGSMFYRNAGWEQADVRIAMVAPGQVAYNQLHGALYYASGDTVPVRPGGTVLLVASPALPGLSGLIATGQAQAVRTPLPITGFQVWRILPGTSILGVRTVTSTVPPDLGTGI